MFYINFINQCARLNVTPAKVAREIGVSGAAVSKWKNGSKPSDVTLAKLAEYFGVTVDDLMAEAENEQTKKAPDVDTSEDEELSELLEELKNNPGKRLLFSKTKSATKEDIEKIIAMVDILTGGKDNGGYYY